MKGGNRRCLKSRDQIHSNFEFCTFLPYCWTRKVPSKKSGFSTKNWKFDFLRDLAKMTKLCLLLGAIHLTHGLNNFNANAVRRKVSRKVFLIFSLSPILMNITLLLELILSLSNSLKTTGSNFWLHRCWWQMLETKCVGDGYGHFSHQHPLPIYISVGHQYSKEATSTLSHQHQDVIYINVTQNL